MNYDSEFVSMFNLMSLIISHTNCNDYGSCIPVLWQIRTDQITKYSKEKQKLQVGSCSNGYLSLNSRNEGGWKPNFEWTVDQIRL